MRDHLREQIGGLKTLVLIAVLIVHKTFLCQTINMKIKVVTQRSGIML